MAKEEMVAREIVADLQGPWEVQYFENTSWWGSVVIRNCKGEEILRWMWSNRGSGVIRSKEALKRANYIVENVNKANE